jgi:N-acetyl-anhydromuramyl-L-alanine amidase AmpD
VNSSTNTGTPISARTRVVWASFAGAMTLVTGALFVLGGNDAGPMTGRTITPLVDINTPNSMESIFSPDVEIEEGRWNAIVIHHTGEPSGSPASIDATHREQGLAGLGYHFVIGNGVQMGDGEVHAGFRWVDQLAGAHVAGPAGAEWNRNSIGVALVGNGDRRPFTDTQMNRLVVLVSELARTLDIPSDRIYLHTDLAAVSNPGRYFEASALTRVADLIDR